MKLTIDSKTVEAREGETVMQCALRNDISIPHLCTHDTLDSFGACRMCVVEIEGQRGYPTSCTTPAAEGMVVRTDGPAVAKLRRNILGMILLEHPSACLVCGKRELCEQFRPEAEKVGRTTSCHTCNRKDICEVRILADELGVAELPAAPTYQQKPIERTDPFLDRDLNLCILCGRCVRICKQLHGVSYIDFVGRGSETHIGQAFGRSLQEAGCQFCGACIDICPTGCLSERYAKWRGKGDASGRTTCIFCDVGCVIELQSSGGKLITSRSVCQDQPICVLGRFAVPEFLNGRDRLVVATVREDGGIRKAEFAEAIEIAAGRLKEYIGDSFALVCDATCTLEDRYVLGKFTQEVMKSSNYVEISPDGRGVSRASLPKGVKAAILTGNFVDSVELDGLELLVVQDCYPSGASEQADIVLPAAVFAEVDGTLIDRQGKARPLRKACNPPGEARGDWQIACMLAEGMGAKGFAYESAGAIAKEAGLKEGELYAEPSEAPEAAKNFKLRRSYFRGHRIDEKVCGLSELLLEAGAAVPKEVRESRAAKSTGGFAIVAKQEVAPNVHEIVVEAARLAKMAKPGQFCIVMAEEQSERIPYTLADWDAEQGTITLVVLEAGQSSRKLTMLQAGDRIAHVVGPLGVPLEIDEYGTVVLAAGCYGLGAILPIAKAMKAAKNRVVTITEARSHYLHYYRDRLAGVSDEFVQTAIDGSLSVSGHAVDALVDKLEGGEKIDRVIVIGCPFMMMLTGRGTEPYGVKTLAALNPIMLDGTGMCGACRLTVGGKTKFACVDGPFFDAHEVDWDELANRRAAYSVQEIDAVGRTESVSAHAEGAQACGVCAS